MVCTLQCLINRYTGNTTVKVGGICRQKRETCEYEGELDEKDRPHGKGQAINPQGQKFFGLWKHGKRHGPCK